MAGISRVHPDQLVRVTGPFTGPQMAAAIVKAGAGVRRMYQPDLERCLLMAAARSPEGTTFTEAGIPPDGWPARGNIFVTDSNGKRWRIYRDENIYGGYYIKIQEQTQRVHR